MKLKPIASVLSSVGIALIIIGALFKIMHWPFTGITILAGVVMISLGAILSLIQGPKKLFNWLKMVAIVLFGLQLYLRGMHYPYGKEVLYVFWGVLVLLGISWLIKNGEEDDELFLVEKIKGNIFLVITGVLIGGGAIFKVMHWPYASQLLISGMIVAIVWMVKDLFLNQPDDSE